MHGDIELEALLHEAVAEFEEKRRERRRRLARSYVVALVEILLGEEYGMPRRKVIAEMERRRRAEHLPIPRSFDESVQSAFNQHCVQSHVFLKRKFAESEGLFSSRYVDGECVWLVDSARADRWLRVRKAKMAMGSADYRGRLPTIVEHA